AGAASRLRLPPSRPPRRRICSSGRTRTAPLSRCARWWCDVKSEGADEPGLTPLPSSAQYPPMATGDDALLIAIPTYNERDNIDALLTSLLGLHPTAHVVVIDDASPDGTGELVAARAREDSRIHLIGRDRKSGIGSAYRAAFAWALEHGFALVVSMAADWSHAPRDISRLLQAVESADVVVGSRYVPGGRTEYWPRSRLPLCRGDNTLARLLCARPSSHWTSAS